MEIKYDLTKNYFKYFNESQGIFMERNNLKNDKYIFNYLEKNILNIVLAIIIYLINISLFYKNNNLVYTLIDFLCFMLAVLSIFCIINFYCIYLKSKKKLHKGTLIIDDYGITDYSDDAKIGFSYEKIDKIVVGKNTITILTNSVLPIIIFIDRNKENKLLKEVQKYKENIEIIRLKNS